MKLSSSALNKYFAPHGRKLKLGLKGDKNNSNHITVYLHLHNGESLPSDWWEGTTKKKLVHFTLTVVNQKDESQSRHFGEACGFQTWWGGGLESEFT